MSYGDHSHPNQDCHFSGAGTTANRQSLDKFLGFISSFEKGIYRQNNGAVSFDPQP